MDRCISNIIQDYKMDKNKKEEALLEIIQKMQPLIRKYVNRIHCYEIEDSTQELIIALIEAIYNIRDYENDYQCLAYTNSYVRYKYIKLCKKYIYLKEHEELSDFTDVNKPQISIEAYDDILFNVDLEIFLSNLSDMQRAVLINLSNGASDSEIAKQLNVSRQYINRLKKRIFYWNYYDLG